MKKLHTKVRSGFTLIEVLGAMAILAGAIVGIILCGANGMAAATDIERSVRCNLLAEAEMEYLKGVLADDPSLNNWGGNQRALGDGYWVKSWIWQLPGRGELKDAQVWVGYDTDGDGWLSEEETRIWLATMLYVKDWSL